MIADLQLPRMTQNHLERWLELWRETAAAYVLIIWLLLSFERLK